MTSDEQQDRRAKDKGRRVIMIAYFVVVVVVCAICVVEISVQAFSRLRGRATDEKVQCMEGIRGLVAAVDRARSAVDGSNRKESDVVAQYRAGLEPEWSNRGAVRRACRNNADKLRALDAIIHLGFAEEHAVRRNAVELAPFRRRASESLSAQIPALAPSATPAP
ncbi:MAG: hypothetical protein CSA75_03980 [Sorangium cellulosum]|nr:MAG: hypothetical protein CSA75_03980 [Sorangium cellulosum]